MSQLDFFIRPLQLADLAEWQRQRQDLFKIDAEENLTESLAMFSDPLNTPVFVAALPAGGIAGFVEVGSRPYADGCNTGPVGYIEGWYVAPAFRRAGVGRALFRAAEEWARSRGFTEIASDADLDNLISHQAHLALGYQEVGRIVQYKKDI